MTFSTYQYARLAAQALTTTGATTIGTVPASTQWMVQDIDVANVTGSAATITLTLGGFSLFPTITVPANQLLHWTGLYVLNAAETIVATAGTANALTVTAHGQTGV